MKMTTIVAAAITAAFALPMAQAAGDKASGAGATRDDGGAEAMFKNMDKDKDGSITKAEAKGTPHAKDFSKLDKDSDGKLSRPEHAAAPEHAGKKSGAGGTGSSGKKSKY
ncbi:MAG: hypothetical protein ACREUH_13450 [Burkholderiales bacterium]